MVAKSQDFVVKHGLQVSSNLVVGAYTGFASSQQINNGAIISGNVGVGTSTVIAGTRLQVTNGNLRISSANTGILFQDGTLQTTAATNTPSYGLPYTIQFAGAANTFSGDSTNLVWNNTTATLQVNNVSITGTTPATTFGTGALTTAGGASIGGNLYIGGNFTVGGQVNFSNVGGIQNLVVNSLVSNTFVQAATTIQGNNILANVTLGVGTTVANYPVDVYGNIHIGNTATASGLIFPDGSFQTTAARNTPSFGAQGTVQFAGAANAFSGNSDNFFWDTANTQLNVNRVQVNTALTANAIISNVYGVFGQNIAVNSTNISTSATTGALTVAGGVGIAGNLNAGGTTHSFQGNVGIGTTLPAQTLDIVNGHVAIDRGFYYGVQHLTVFYGLVGLNSANKRTFGDLTSNTGTRVQIDVPGIALETNANPILFNNGSLGAETARLTATGNFGLGTASPGSVLDVNGIASFRSAISVAGTATVNSLVSNSSISSTSGIFTGSLYAGSFNTAGTATVNALISNSIINGTALTVTSIQNSGTTTVQSLNSNTNVVATNLQSTGTAIVQSLNSNTNVVATNLQSTGTAIVQSLNSNTNVVATNIQSTGTATVASLVSNGAVSATTITGTAGTFTSLQNSGTTTVQSLNSNTNVVAANLQSTAQTTVQSLLVNTNITTATLNVTGAAQANSINANTSIVGQTGVFTANVGIGTSVLYTGDALRIVGGNINVAVSGTGILFPDGSFQQSSAGSSAAGTDKTVQFNDGGLFAGQNNFIFDKTNNRLGIGTTNLTNSLMVFSATPALFNTTNGADQQLIVGNTATDGIALGFNSSSGTGVNTYGYLSAVGAAAKNISLTKTGTGIGGITIPQNTLDVGGGVAIGFTYAGSITAPSNGLLVQGTIGVGSSAPISKLDVIGGAAFTGAVSAGGALSANSVTSNTFVRTATVNASSTIVGQNLYSNGFVQAAGTVTGQAVVSNSTVTASTGLTVTAGGMTVTGTSSFTGNINVTGNLNVTGAINTTESNVLVVQDPLIYVGQNNPSDLYDLGIVGAYTEGSYYNTGIVRNHNDNFWTVFDTLTATPNVITGNIDWTDSTLTYGPFKAGNIVIAGNTASTGTNSGAMIINGTGGLGIGGRLNVGGSVWFAGAVNAGGTAIVNALISNTTINGGVTTVTTLQSNSATVQSLNSNTNVVAVNLQSTGTATVASLTSNGAISGTTINGTATTVTSLQSSGTATVNALTSNGAVSGTTGTFTGALYGASFNTAGTATVNSLVSNGAISGTTGTFTSALYGASFNTAGTATVNALVSNGAISGTTGTFTSALYGASFNTAGTATVNALVSNGAISGTTVNGTAGTFTSLQVSGTTTTNAVVSNVYGLFGQNVTVNSTNASTSTTTGALIVAGGVGAGGNIRSGGTHSSFSGNVGVGVVPSDTRLAVVGSGANTSRMLSVTAVGVGGGSTAPFYGAYIAVGTNNSASAAYGTYSELTYINGQISYAGYFKNVGQPSAASYGIYGETTQTDLNGPGAAYGGYLKVNSGASGTLGSTYALRLESNVTTGVASYGLDISTLAGATNVYPINISHAGSIRLRMDGTGNVGIGSATSIVGSLFARDITSNSSINSTTGIFTGALYSGSFNTAGTATVNTLVSNGAISGTTVTGTVGTFTSLQNSGTSTTNALVSNVYGLFGQNVTVNSTNTSTSSTTGALILAGGAGIGGNINVGGANSLFTNRVGIGTSTVLGARANVLAVYGNADIYGNIDLANPTGGTSGIYFSDGTYQTTAAGSTTPYSNANVASYLSGPVQIGNLTINNTTASTSTLTGALLMGGGAGIQGAVHIGGLIYGASTLNIAGAAQVNSLISNGAVSGTTGTFTGALYGGSFNTAGTATVNSLVSNGAVSGTSGTFTSALYSATFNTAGVATVNSLTSNGAVSGTTGTFTSALYSGSFNSAGTATVNSLVSNGAVSGTTGTFTSLQSSGTTTVNALVSNGAVSGTNGTFTGALYGGNFNTAGTATVNALVSNGAITGTTINGTAATFTSIQNSGSTIVQSLNSNTNVVATNLQSTGLTSVASLVVNAGITAQTLTTSGAAIVSSLTSNNTIQSAGALTAASITSNAGISGTSATIANNLYSGTANINGSLQAGSIASNGAVSGTTGTFAGALYGGNFNTAGTATVNALVSNTDVRTATVNASSTIVGANIYSNGFVQAAGTVTGQAVSSNTTITAGTGLTITSGGMTVTGTSSFTGNVNITGNVNVTGSINSTASNILVVQDPLIYVGQNNPSDLYDLGIVGAYTEGAYYNTGIVRNHNDNFWTVFDTLTATPNVITGNIDWTDSTITYGPFKAGNIVIAGNTASVGTTSGAMVINGTGGLGLGGRLNVGGSAWFAGAVNAGGTAIVNALISNTTINGGVTTVTTFQSSSATVQSLNSNTNVVATNIQSTGQATVASLVSNGAISGTTINGTSATVTSLQNSGTETVNTLISNVYGRFGQNVTVGSTNASTSTTTGAFVVSGGVGAAGAIHAGGQIYSASTLNIAGAAQVNSLISNGAISGTSGTFTSIQNSGQTLTNSLVANVFARFGQNVEIDSSNASTSSSTGALQVAGGVGIAGNLNVDGANNLFTNRVGIGTSSVLGAGANVLSVYGTENIFGNIVIANTAAGGSGIYFPDGSFQTTGTAIGGVNQSVQFNDNGLFGGQTNFIYDKTNIRLGIGTTDLTNSLMVFSATPAWFNTTNGADQQIIIGNSTSTGTVIGFNSSSGTGLNTNGYISAIGAAARNISITRTGTGIGGVTLPQNTLEIGGTTIIGGTYSGNNNFINAPSNGLAVQGSVGVGTFTPVSTLDVRGGGAFTGAVNVGGTATVNAIVSNVYGRFGQNVTVNSTNASTTSASGALVVAGGAGIAGRLNVGDASWFATTLNAGGAFIANSINSNTNVVGVNLQSTGVTTVNALVSNTDVKTATVNASSTIVGNGIKSNSYIQSAGVATVNSFVANTTAIINGTVTVNGTANSTSTSSGALTVAGGVGIIGNLYVGGNIIGAGNVTVFVGNSGVFYGDGNGFGALYAGVPTGYVFQPNTVLQLSANINDYSQFNIQNINPGINASTDIVATADNGTADDGYINMGINSSGWDVPNSADRADDGYLFMVGNVTNGTGNLVIGVTSNQHILFTTGGTELSNIQVSINHDQGLHVENLNDSTSTNTGAFIVDGGVGIGSAVHIGGLIYGASTLNIADTAQVNSLVSNGTVSGTTGTFTGALYGGSFNTAGTATVNALTSNGAVSGTTGTFTSALYGGSFNTAGTATVNALVSNGAISATTITGTTGTFTSIQNSGLEQVANLVSNTWIHATQNLTVASSNTSTSTTTGALVVTGGAGIGGALHVSGQIYSASLNIAGAVRANSLISNSAVSGVTGAFSSTLFGGTFNTAGTAIVNTLASNGAITGTALTVTSSQNSGQTLTNSLVANVFARFGQNVTVSSTNASTSTTTGAFILAGGAGITGAIHVGGLIYGASTLNIAGAAQVNSLVSNGAVSGTTGTFTGALYGGSFNTAGTATVNALVSNGAISGTAFTVTSLQSSGTATVNALVSNVYGLFGQNVTVNSTNASTSTTTGAIVTLGGVGIAGNVNTGGVQNTFTGNVGVGTTTVGAGYRLQVVGAFAATTKSFVIDHPTKPGKLLRYGSLEGPENGVYVRGRITGDTEIPLPDYWSALVDDTTITVNLTPIGSSRLPRVDRIENNTVYLKKPLVGLLDYYFVVFGERKDVGKLDVEI